MAKHLPRDPLYVAIAIALLTELTACASIPTFPAAGPHQATAPVLVNPHCVSSCTATNAQTVVQDNTAPVTVGAPNQQTQETKSTTTTTETKPVP